MIRHEFIERLNRYCKIDYEETWVDIMPVINALFDSFEKKEADKINDCENNCIHRNSDKIMDLGCYECSRYYSDKFETKGER